MIDADLKGSIWQTNAESVLAVIEAKTKDVKKILESRKKHGFIVIEGDENLLPKTIGRLKSLGWIKETKDAYVLTQKGKKEVENYESLRRRGLI